MIRRVFTAAISIACVATAVGCMPIPLREARPPERPHFVGREGRQTRYVDVRDQCKPNSLIHVGVTRAEIHQWLGPEDLPGDFDLGARTLSTLRGAEVYGFVSQVEEFYLLSVEGPFRTVMGGDLYLLAVRYGNDDRVKECHVYRIWQGQIVQQYP